MKHFDVIVIGGGHAGCEAALATSKRGLKTALLTLDLSKIGEMSCNPSVGGVGKGQLVKELDALGGAMGRNADYTGIQFKRLNTKKGSAVVSSRCQSDKKLYALRMQKVLSQEPHLTLLKGEVKGLLVEGHKVTGIQLIDGELFSRTVIITSGTFMRGLIHIGAEKLIGGRYGEERSVGLSDRLKDLGFSIHRLKTGTPPRLIRESIDFSVMSLQLGDEEPRKFSFFESAIPLPQLPCYLTYTNSDVHETIRSNIDKSPLFSGEIKGVGPRYCPSIEDKVVKFPQKEAHMLFFEPEALDSNWIYPNGISTSLPREVQEAFIRRIPGCEKVEFARYGYAVEYDCIDPKQLKPSLESKEVEGLFFAGQVNGTSGYEEAAAQGLMAGINAGNKILGKDPLVLGRDESYIGVMIDDLTRFGVSEPYRMFTSRAEFRLVLREDNADLRLSRYGHELGLLTNKEMESVEKRRAQIETARPLLGKTILKPSPEINSILQEIDCSPIEQALSLEKLLKRPEVGIEHLEQMGQSSLFEEMAPQVKETLEIEVKYAGYIELQRLEILRLRRMEGLGIPEGFNYGGLAGLSHELKEKLSYLKPSSLGEAAQIKGMTPAGLTSLLFGIKNEQKTI